MELIAGDRNSIGTSAHFSVHRVDATRGSRILKPLIELVNGADEVVFPFPRKLFVEEIVAEIPQVDLGF